MWRPCGKVSQSVLRVAYTLLHVQIPEWLLMLPIPEVCLDLHHPPIFRFLFRFENVEQYNAEMGAIRMMKHVTDLESFSLSADSRRRHF